MCIVLVSTAHPDYPFILLSNRDEYLNRPTAKAGYWDPPLGHVLGGRDLQRDVRGTWLGITRQGRIAALTNFHEEGHGAAKHVTGIRSRGELPLAWLTSPPDSNETAEDSAKRMIEEQGVDGIGGFSLLFGQLRKKAVGRENRPLGIISNRTPDVHGVIWPNEPVYGLSNSRYGDHGWPKVVSGERELKDIVTSKSENSKGGLERDTKDVLVERLFSLLSIDTYPEIPAGLAFEIYARKLRETIFVPIIEGNSKPESTLKTSEFGNTVEKIEEKQKESTQGSYGTQKQTVILVDRTGHVTFVERTVFGPDGESLTQDGKKGQDSVFEFEIEGWNE